jgi:transposase-like protein
MSTSRSIELGPTPADSRPVALASLRLPIKAIVPPPAERRLREADDDQLTALADSLRDHGQLQAIGVRAQTDGCYQLIFGLRRLTAARQAGFRDINAVVFNASDDQVLLLAVVENLHRRELTATERVQALRMVAAVHRPGTQPGGHGHGPGKLHPPHEQPFSFNGLARTLAVSQPTVARWVKLAGDAMLLEAVERGELTLTTASFIAGAPVDARRELVDQVKRGDLPRRDVRDRVRGLCRVQRSRVAAPARHGDAEATTRSLQRALAELEVVVGIRTEAELQLLEQVADRVQRLREAAELRARRIA